MTLATSNQSRYIPKESVPLTLPDVEAVVYLYHDKRAGIAYRGKANKPAWHFSFRSPDQAEAHANKWLDDMRRNQEAKAAEQIAKQEARHAGHPYHVGDILHYSWGWEQTNCEFYQVIAVTPGTVTLKQIASRSVPKSAGFMSEMRVAVKDAFLGDAILKRPTCQAYDGKAHWHIAMEFGSASPWDGKPCYSSWYA